MLYFKALTEGLAALPQADPGVRAAIDARAARDGWPALHAELARVDPATAARLAPSDAQRIQRALEVHALTGMPLSALQGARDVRGRARSAIALRSCRPTARRCTRAIARALRRDARGGAGRRAARRCARATRCTPRCRRCAASATGRRGNTSTAQIDAPTLRARGIAATRQLAKRQLTWLRGIAADADRALRAGVIERVTRDRTVLEAGRAR